MDRVKTVFFDLDNTLFDHRTAERQAHRILFDRYRGLLPGVEFEEWLQTYAQENERLWAQMSEGAVSPGELRVLRFSNTFLRLGGMTDHVEQLATEYVRIYSAQSVPCPNVKPALDYLSQRYELGVLSNGFADIQGDKLALLGIGDYFRYVVYSDSVGALKPNPEIFNAALARCKRQPEEVVYIGDSYDDDVVGAKRAGWHAILYNPAGGSIDNGLADAQITDLLELKKIL